LEDLVGDEILLFKLMSDHRIWRCGLYFADSG